MTAEHRCMYKTMSYILESTEQTHMWYLKIISHMHIFYKEA